MCMVRYDWIFVKPLFKIFFHGTASVPNDITAHKKGPFSQSLLCHFAVSPTALHVPENAHSVTTPFCSMIFAYSAVSPVATMQ